MYLTFDPATFSPFTSHVADVDDPEFAKKLTDLFREGLGDKDISARFEAECGLKIRLVVSLPTLT
jgi:hypothetical protein